jgi:NAD(P)-dependent dehydrogenase (short-subunit alcohol dehydrogenase family)
VLFAVGLDARAKQRGVRAFAVHPGGILTDLVRHLSDEELAAMGISDRGLTPTGLLHSPISNSATTRFKTVEQGAATSIWAATHPMLEGKGGVYCEDCDIARVVEETGASGVKRWAIDPDLADQLWKRSQQWTGVEFSP